MSQAPAPSVSPSVAPAAAATSYRYLRLAMALVLAMLAVAVVLEILRPDPSAYVDDSAVLDSISAYYWTSVRSVFVASLVALGVGMIALRPETDLEDLLLDLAGALAPVVAFVPTPLPDDCLLLDTPTGCGLPPEASDAVTNNVTAYLVAAALALTAYVVIARVSAPEGVRVVARAPGPRRVRAFGVLLLVAALVATATWLGVDPDSFGARAHLAAAIPMFGCIVAVVLINAVRATTRGGRRHRACPVLYWALLAVMVAGAGCSVVLGGLGVTERGTLYAEVSVLGPFLVFWLVQTVELWDEAVEPARDRVWPYGTDWLPWRRGRWLERWLGR